MMLLLLTFLKNGGKELWLTKQLKAMSYSKQLQKINKEASRRVAHYAYYLQQLVWSVKHSEDEKLIDSYLNELQTTIDTISDIYRKEVC